MIVGSNQGAKQPFSLSFLFFGVDCGLLSSSSVLGTGGKIEQELHQLHNVHYLYLKKLQ